MKTNSNLAENRIFGGEIDLEDFNTYKPNQKRILKQIKANSLQEDLLKKIKTANPDYNHLTLQELKEKQIISNTEGRPLDSLTNEQWQQEFRIRKSFIQTTSQKKLNCRQFREPDLWNPESNSSYHGATQWQNYCWYMNDVLRVIRKGDKDYCYFIYQVMELARFHFHELKTKYIPQYKCWEVWLDL